MLLIVDTSALHIKTNIHMLFALYQRFMLKRDKMGDNPKCLSIERHECVIRQCFTKTR